MKNYLSIFLLAIILIGCNTESNESKTQSDEQVVKKEIVILTVDQLLNQKENLVDKEIVFKGTVDHVCKHSGKRAFVFGSTEDLRIKIEAGGEIRGFDAELIGTDIEVKGVLKELRIDEAYINQMEDNMKENHDGEGDGEGHDDEEEHKKQEEQIKNLRAEIATIDKGYKSIYHIDGISFTKID
jgi:hypothetical protein